MTQIELADTQLAAVTCTGSRVVLRLSTAPAWQPGEGADTRPVAGHLLGVELAFDDAHCSLDAGCCPSACIGAVREALLLQGGQALRKLAVPGSVAGRFTLTLSLRNGAGLCIRARHLRLDQPAGGRFIESLAC